MPLFAFISSPYLETVFRVSSIPHETDGAVRFNQGVFAADNIAITMLFVVLKVAGVRVFYSVRIGVVRFSLDIENKLK